MADHPGTQHSGHIGDGEETLCLGCGVLVWVYAADEHAAKRCPWKHGDPTWAWDARRGNTEAMMVRDGVVINHRRPPLESP